MAIHKFLIKKGKGIHSITANDLVLIDKDPTEDLRNLDSNITSIEKKLDFKIDYNNLTVSNNRLTQYTSSINNRVYKLSYDIDDQDLEFRFLYIQGSRSSSRSVYINSDTDNKIKFTVSGNSMQLVVPEGKLPSFTGKGKVIHVQTLFTENREEIIYLSGDLDYSNTEDISTDSIILDQASPHAVAKIWSGSQEQYDAIPFKEPDVLYFITDPGVTNDTNR